MGQPTCFLIARSKWMVVVVHFDPPNRLSDCIETLQDFDWSNWIHSEWKPNIVVLMNVVSMSIGGCLYHTIWLSGYANLPFVMRFMFKTWSFSISFFTGWYGKKCGHNTMKAEDQGLENVPWWKMWPIVASAKMSSTPSITAWSLQHLREHGRSSNSCENQMINSGWDRGRFGHSPTGGAVKSSGHLHLKWFHRPRRPFEAIASDSASTCSVEAKEKALSMLTHLVGATNLPRVMTKCNLSLHLLHHVVESKISHSKKLDCGLVGKQTLKGLGCDLSWTYKQNAGIWTGFHFCYGLIAVLWSGYLRKEKWVFRSSLLPCRWSSGSNCLGSRS